MTIHFLGMILKIYYFSYYIEEKKDCQNLVLGSEYERDDPKIDNENTHLWNLRKTFLVWRKCA